MTAAGSHVGFSDVLGERCVLRSGFDVRTVTTASSYTSSGRSRSGGLFAAVADAGANSMTFQIEWPPTLLRRSRRTRSGHSGRVVSASRPPEQAASHCAEADLVPSPGSKSSTSSWDAALLARHSPSASHDGRSAAGSPTKRVSFTTPVRGFSSSAPRSSSARICRGLTGGWYKRSRESRARALQLAGGAAAGRAYPKPTVGAVVVRDGEVVGEGVTEPGGRHAEVVALEAAGRRARGATLFVTLEPCSPALGLSYPPCTDRIIAEGVARVVVGARDPNPEAAGGIEVLRAGGRRGRAPGCLGRSCPERGVASLGLAGSSVRHLQGRDLRGRPGRRSRPAVGVR